MKRYLEPEQIEQVYARGAIETLIRSFVYALRLLHDEDDPQYERLCSRGVYEQRVIEAGLTFMHLQQPELPQFVTVQLMRPACLTF